MTIITTSPPAHPAAAWPENGRKSRQITGPSHDRPRCSPKPNTKFRRDDLGDDGVWDNWRIEGPAFVWYFRGAPHVHSWIHVADTPKTPVTSHFG